MVMVLAHPVRNTREDDLLERIDAVDVWRAGTRERLMRCGAEAEHYKAVVAELDKLIGVIAGLWKRTDDALRTRRTPGTGFSYLVASTEDLRLAARRMPFIRANACYAVALREPGEWVLLLVHEALHNLRRALGVDS